MAIVRIIIFNFTWLFAGKVIGVIGVYIQHFFALGASERGRVRVEIV